MCSVPTTDEPLGIGDKPQAACGLRCVRPTERSEGGSGDVRSVGLSLKRSRDLPEAGDGVADLLCNAFGNTFATSLRGATEPELRSELLPISCPTLGESQCSHINRVLYACEV